MYSGQLRYIILSNMNKRRLHHASIWLRQLRPWYFLVLALLSTVVCVLALRANNEHMVKLRDTVYQADKDNGDVQGALRNLQAYVTAHMNTNLSTGSSSVYPPIQLKYTYDRLVQAQGNAATQANSQIYTDAQHYCEAQNHTDFSGRNRVPCIQQYVQSHTTSANAPIIPDSLYKFAFISPRWSPDLAGWTLLVSAISYVLFVASFLLDRWFRHQLA
jgi:hypothetical protein